MLSETRIQATLFTLAPFIAELTSREQILIAHLALASGVDFAVRVITELDCAA